MKVLLSLTFAALSLLLAPYFAEAAEPPTEPVRVRIHDTQGKTVHQFSPFGDDYFGHASITSADINGDSVDEIIVGSGAQHDPVVRIFDQSGTLLHEFTAYHPKFRHGVHVAACDLDQDGAIEVITSPSEGGGPHIRVFNLDGTLWNNVEFFAYDPAFRGGARVTCGNVDRDIELEIITGPGLTGGPHLKAFSSSGNLEDELFVGSLPSNSGLQVQTTDSNGDGIDEIIGTEIQDGSHYLFVVEMLNGSLVVTDYELLGEGLENVSISPFLFEDTGLEVLVSHGYKETTVSIHDLKARRRAEFSPFSTPGHGSQTISVQNGDRFLQASMNDSGNHRLQTGQYILVDISDQRLYAFEHGVLHDTFLISSGLPAYETPRGTFNVMAKLPTHTYRWSFGANDSRNYEIPNVKWNLRFLRHFYIHSATWHTNFGHKMSHGCVNASVEDAERLFSWARNGTTVEVTD